MNASYIFTKGIGFLFSGIALSLYLSGDILKAMFFLIFAIFWVVVTK